MHTSGELLKYFYPQVMKKKPDHKLHLLAFTEEDALRRIIRQARNIRDGECALGGIPSLTRDFFVVAFLEFKISDIVDT